MMQDWLVCHPRPVRSSMADPRVPSADQESQNRLGPLIVLSGPSGSGKTTVLERLLAESGLPLHLSVSATTRSPRRGERDGKDYCFWTRERFEKEKDAGA